MNATAASPLRSAPSRALSGSVAIPGDKSVSHRALIFGALAVGTTRIAGLLEGEDVLNTARALHRLGVPIERAGAAWEVHGVGIGGLAEPDGVLDLGNSGTGARLLMGVAATHPFTSFFTGDESLCRRPMARVTEPLSRMGARFVGRDGSRLPLAVIGARDALPIEYRLPVPSAQVKSAVLLAGLNAPGETSVIEPEPTRDHTENMLRHFGARIAVDDGKVGRRITVVGQPELTASDLTVPGDPSSAAFPLVAALLVPGSALTITGVGLNKLRTGLFETLIEMGADIKYENRRTEGGEPIADLAVRASALRGVTVPAERAPSMIDEYPILGVAAAFARGRTTMHGLKELRVKESDRLSAMATGLAACGVTVAVEGDSLIIDGTGAPPPGGGAVAARLDHRIAMSFLVMGMAAKAATRIDDGATIETSFPGFAALMNGVGANIGPG
ncbi:MAG TPA: 3-phosphoshikimate 1-carboxyvinyltransferase [Stellaceae bacterium]|nr:3-phosphoshikimate 1-carboxyvinyltransferase [Stellaceae bacterium]